MKRTKRIFFLTLLCMLVMLAASSALHAGSIVPAPVNPEFIKYLEDLRSGTAAHRIPPKAYLLPPKARPRAARAVSAEETLPVSFDLAEKGWVTRVKDQRRWGTCWDFATVEAMESSLKKETGVEYELSELHLGFFAYCNESEEKPAFDQHAEPDMNPIFDNGGYPYTSRAILSRGTGPVYEKDAPYPTADYEDEEFWRDYPEDREALKRELLAVRPAFRLKESLTFNDPNEIKRALMEYGGLLIGFNASNAAEDPSNQYIYSDNPASNHAVMLVGWDDTIAASNFKDEDGDTPQNNGAWKIQNSWGDSAGDHGYYWISYEDESIKNEIMNEYGATSFIAMPADSYRYTYSHDPLGSIFAIEAAGSTATTANVFTAERDEDIVCVGFTTMDDDNIFSIQIYKNVPAGGMPDDGTPVLSKLLTGAAEFSGYRTVKLDMPVPLAKGERFAVAVVLMDDDDKVIIPVEAKIDGLTSQASAKPGESFVYDDDDEGWEEVMNQLPQTATLEGDTVTFQPKNLTIKAFTESSGGSSGGCSTGASFGAFALLLAALVPLARRGR